MGYQLPISDCFKIIQEAIRMASDNLGGDLHHRHTEVGRISFVVEISDWEILNKLTDNDIDYADDDYIMMLNIPLDYFNDDIRSEDKALGISVIDDAETKAEIRCINYIQQFYAKWIKQHQVFTTDDLRQVVNQALSKLRKIKNIDLNVYAGTGKLASTKNKTYLSIFFTWSCIAHKTTEDDFFNVTFNIDEYYKAAGDHDLDSLIGVSNLKGKDKKDICLLRVAYILVHISESFLLKHHRDLYDAWKAGKL